MNKRIKWHLETWKIDRLIPYEKNPRIIKEEGLNTLKKSFDEIGFAQPININVDGTILSGHARVMQLKREKAEEVDVYVPDRKLTPKQEEAVVIRMNKNTAGEWDFDALTNLWDEEDLIEWGFSEKEFVLPPVEVDLPDIGNGADPDTQTKSFILSNDQADSIDRAIAKMKKDPFYIEDEINANSNGTALALICEQYANS